ncbi:MAG: Fe-S cluster assembly transcriptional regulator IscR, partial [Gammaproteobacteria bacterium]
HDLWEELSRQITKFLSGISLADLVERQAVRRVAQRQDSAPIHLHLQQPTH